MEEVINNEKWDKRFMDVAELVATWSSCFQENRQIGSVIAKNKRILTTGYNGASSGIESCKDRGNCMRRDLGIPSGTRHEMCYATHAEQNAIIQAARLRENDHQQRYPPHRVQARLSRRVRAETAARGGGGSGRVPRGMTGCPYWPACASTYYY